MRIVCPIFVWLIFGMGTVAEGVDRAADPHLKIVDLVLGFDGHYKLGYWVPATVTLAWAPELPRPACCVEIDAPDSDGVMVTYPGPEKAGTAPDPNGHQTVPLLIRVGRADARFHVRAVHDGTLLAEKTFVAGLPEYPGVRQGLAGTTQLLLALGPPLGLADALADGSAHESMATHVVALDRAGQLPADPLAYEGIDAVVLAIGQADSAAAELSATQVLALDQWQIDGGRIVLVAGAQSASLIGPGGRMASWVPGQFRGMQTLLQATAIEAFCNSQYPVRSAGRTLELSVPRLDNVRGQVLVHEGNRPSDLPLLVREPRGLGELTWIGFDLAAPPLATWAGRPYLLSRLFETLPEDTYQSIASASGGLTSLGYNDITGQLRAALDEFTGTRAVPFALITLLATLYIALIGPLDYWVVRRWLARPALTWITLPLWIFLFSLLAWWVARDFKSPVVRANSVELVDVDATTGQVRGTLWAHLYSPRIQSFHLALAPCLPDGTRPAESRSFVAWLGLPGNALGGMQAHGDDSPFARGYRIDPALGTLDRLPLSVASTKSLTGRWSARTERVVRADLEDPGDGLLRGRIENGTGGLLTNVRLLYGQRAWVLGDLADGATIDLSSVRDPLSIRTVLTRTRRGVSVPGDLEISDPTTTRLEPILDRMMWYQQIGGPSYVRLLHRYQGYSDMSRLLDLGRAILVGSVAGPGSRLLESGHWLGTADDKKRIIYRCVLPVRSELDGRETG